MGTSRHTRIEIVAQNEAQFNPLADDIDLHHQHLWNDKTPLDRRIAILQVLWQLASIREYWIEECHITPDSVVTILEDWSRCYYHHLPYPVRVAIAFADGADGQGGLYAVHVCNHVTSLYTRQELQAIIEMREAYLRKIRDLTDTYPALWDDTES